MKLSVILGSVLTSAAAVSGWEISIYGQNSRVGTMHGTVSTGCIKLNYSPPLIVRSVKVSGVYGADFCTDTGCKSCYSVSSGSWSHFAGKTILAYRVAT
ncbi:hypothetical protein V8F20_001329 [Naviculisporaceae sp. PSN 640]